MTPALPNPFIGDMHATAPMLTSADLAAILAEIERAIDLPAFLVAPSEEYLEMIAGGVQ